MKKEVLGLIFLVVILCIPFVAADGMLLKIDRSDMALYEEDSQVAAITYSNRTENLIMAIKTSQMNGSAVWILPIPSKGEDIKIDVRNFPRLEGTDLVEEERRNALSNDLGFVVFLGASGYFSPLVLIIYAATFLRMGITAGTEGGGDGL